MKERGILFSAPMVRAILAGRKTQTRRIVKLPDAPNHLGQWEASTVGGVGVRTSTDEPTIEQTVISHTRTGHTIACPYGVVGDRLWVRETWKLVGWDWDQPSATVLFSDGQKYIGEPRDDIEAWLTREVGRIEDRAGVTIERVNGAYDARLKWDSDDVIPWRPSIFLPRWLSRITLEVTRVRVERLHEITEDDARAEGVDESDGEIDEVALCAAAKAMGTTPDDSRAWFATLWDSINGERATWSSNPFVWAIEFKRVH